MCRLGLEHFEAVAVQPLQTIPGQEHGEVRLAVEEAAEHEHLLCRVGAPRWHQQTMCAPPRRRWCGICPQTAPPTKTWCLWGMVPMNSRRQPAMWIANAVHALDSRVHVGAMNGAVTLDSILPNLVSHRVWLASLLSVVGRHALEDMAGENGHSWRSRIEAHGHQCLPVLMGTAEYAGVAEIWLRHLEDAVQPLAAGWEKR